ncbi:MAG: thiamine phosphate synthase [Kiritimatiellae bacterium]|nr:thiamine phosphate synthase [Kiritimatiellia bacterium]
MKDFGFYLVMTNPAVGYEKCAEAAVKAGVKMLQLRMKHVDERVVAQTALRVKAITDGTETNFILNDSPQLAADTGADGVHVGQTDMPPGEVRRLFPQIKIVGLSTHNMEQMRSAISQPVDYVGVGPVYATPTKDIPDPVLTPAGAGEMIAAAPFPAVAIGGINLANLAEVKAAGARNFAVVREVCLSQDPYAAIRRLQEAFANA